MSPWPWKSFGCCRGAWSYPEGFIVIQPSSQIVRCFYSGTFRGQSAIQCHCKEKHHLLFKPSLRPQPGNFCQVWGPWDAKQNSVSRIVSQISTHIFCLQRQNRTWIVSATLCTRRHRLTCSNREGIMLLLTTSLSEGPVLPMHGHCRYAAAWVMTWPSSYVLCTQRSHFTDKSQGDSRAINLMTQSEVPTGSDPL